MARLTKAKSFRETLDPHLVELLLQAKDQILAAPDAFQMSGLAQKTHGGCGAAFCILGHMAVLDDPDILRARGIHRQVHLIAAWGDRLFEDMSCNTAWVMLAHFCNWPEQFVETPESAAARIDYWLETGK